MGVKRRGKRWSYILIGKTLGEKVTGESKVFVPFESLAPLLRVCSVMSDTSERKVFEIGYGLIEDPQTPPLSEATQHCGKNMNF